EAAEAPGVRPFESMGLPIDQVPGIRVVANDDLERGIVVHVADGHVLSAEPRALPALGAGVEVVDVEVGIVAEDEIEMAVSVEVGPRGAADRRSLRRDRPLELAGGAVVALYFRARRDENLGHAPDPRHTNRSDLDLIDIAHGIAHEDRAVLPV